MDKEHWDDDQNSKGLKQNVSWKDLIKQKEYMKSLLATDKILQGYKR